MDILQETLLNLARQILTTGYLFLLSTMVWSGELEFHLPTILLHIK